MQIPVRIADQEGNAFIDTGCSFNAVSSDYAARCNLQITEHDNDLSCAVGGGSRITIKRRVAKCTFDLLGLGTLETYVFVMDPIPFNCDIIFGMNFMEVVNPQIDWNRKQVVPPLEPPHFTISDEMKHQELMFHFMEQEYLGNGEPTKVITMEEFERSMNAPISDGSFYFIINPADIPPSTTVGKCQRYKDQGWMKLSNNPAFSILEKYKDSVFRDTLTMDHVVPGSAVEHSIELTDSSPVTVKQFRTSPEQGEAVAAWVADMLSAGLIRPSSSPYSSPLFCVKKPIGWRIVHDYRLLNAKTKIPQEPIPRKDDIIDSMHGGYWFSCMDLLSGYYQLRIREQDRAFTAFSTPNGHFEYLVIAQGLAGAPATFNRFVQSIFTDLRDISRAFFDDIYVFTKSPDINEHLAALDRVLQRCQKTGLSIKLSKCVFASDEIPVLGDFVGRKGVRIDPEKVAVISNWPVPRTRTQLKSFLGVSQYCARFCQGYGELVAPLHEATQGKRKFDALNLTEFQRTCFIKLQSAMSSTPILALPDPSKPYGIRMDASDYAIGGVLFQLDNENKEQPIAFAGRKMTRAEKLYPVREKELLAVIFAMKCWRPYLLDRPFSVETDHQTLQELLTQRTCSQRLARWLNFISEYRPIFKWIPGITNDVADGISRRVDFVPDQPASSVTMRELFQSILDHTNEEEDDQISQPSLQFANCDHALMVFQLLSARDISALCRVHYPTDKVFGPIWKSFFTEGKETQNVVDNKGFNQYVFSKGLLWFSRTEGGVLRLCIPSNNELQNKILFSEHDDPSKGHPGVFKTTKFLQRKYYWPNMDNRIKQYVASCQKCQRNKFRQTKAPGRLNVLPIPEARWQHISMDFITSLPPCGKYNSIWVIVDRLTKRAHFIPVCMGEGDSSAKSCANIFRKEYQRLHGIPETIISDRDCRFTSVFWQEFMVMQGSKHFLSSAFRPNTDGQTERTNRFVEDYIRNYVHANQDNWEQLLYSAELAYNSRVHASIGMSPFEADLGYIPRAVPDHIFDKIVGTKSNQEILALGQQQQRVLEQLKITLNEAQIRMKQYYDKNRPIQDFEIGDEVLLSTKFLDIEHLGISKKGTAKFGPLWIGPYPILSKTTPDTYKISLPVGLRLHPEFHTSLLKRYKVDSSDNRLNKPNEGMIGAEGIEDAYLVEDVVNHKRVQGKIMFLVKWLGYPSSDNTWEEYANIYKPAAGLINRYVSRNKLSNRIWNPRFKL